jgi:hypothetical protein
MTQSCRSAHCKCAVVFTFSTAGIGLLDPKPQGQNFSIRLRLGWVFTRRHPDGRRRCWPLAKGNSALVPESSPYHHLSLFLPTVLSFHCRFAHRLRAPRSCHPLSSKGVVYLSSTYCLLQSIPAFYYSYSRFQLFCLPYRLPLILGHSILPYLTVSLPSSRLVSSSRHSSLCQSFPFSPSLLTTGFSYISTLLILLNCITVLMSDFVSFLEVRSAQIGFVVSLSFSFPSALTCALVYALTRSLLRLHLPTQTLFGLGLISSFLRWNPTPPSDSDRIH